MNHTSRFQWTTGAALAFFLLIFLQFSLTTQSRASVSADTCTVLFKVNMQWAISDSVFDPSTDQLWVTADQGIDPFRLVAGPNHMYSGQPDQPFESGVFYHYRFRINDTVFETIDRTFTAVPGALTLSTWWNNSLLKQSTFTVNMAFAESSGLFNPLTDSVCLFGSLNNHAGPLTLQRDGTSSVYTLALTPDPGVIHTFRYSINADSTGFELQGKPDRMVRISDTVDTFLADFNNLNPGKLPMTMQCNMRYYIATHAFSPVTGFLDVAGNFNGNGSNDLLFDADNDSIYSTILYLDTTWISQGPLQFKFRIGGDWNLAELQGKPFREYAFHDTTQQQNLFSCFYNDLDPLVPAPPRASDLSIQGSLVYKKILSGTYSYENLNGIAEGASVYRWYRSTNAQGTDAVAIDSAVKLTYVVDTLDIGHWLVFEVTPVAVSGDSAVGRPVRVVSSNSISAWDVGIGELSALRVRLYPNPASDYVTVEADNEIIRIEVIDLTGRIVLADTRQGFINPPISISSLPGGFYLLRARFANGAFGTARLIIR